MLRWGENALPFGVRNMYVWLCYVCICLLSPTLSIALKSVEGGGRKSGMRWINTRFTMVSKCKLVGSGSKSLSITGKLWLTSMLCALYSNLQHQSTEAGMTTAMKRNQKKKNKKSKRKSRPPQAGEECSALMKETVWLLESTWKSGNMRASTVSCQGVATQTKKIPEATNLRSVGHLPRCIAEIKSQNSTSWSSKWHYDHQVALRDSKTMVLATRLQWPDNDTSL